MCSVSQVEILLKPISWILSSQTKSEYHPCSASSRLFGNRRFSLMDWENLRRILRESAGHHIHITMVPLGTSVWPLPRQTTSPSCNCAILDKFVSQSFREIEPNSSNRHPRDQPLESRQDRIQRPGFLLKDRPHACRGVVGALDLCRRQRSQATMSTR